MSEVRTFAEGTLRFVQASGSGRTWATGATPPSALMAFVQNGFSFTSAQTITTIMERGVPNHHKITEQAPIKVNLSQLLTNATGQLPMSTLTASGTTVPMVHAEWKQAVGEMGAGSAVYYQFYGVATESFKPTEDTKGNKGDYSLVCLGYTGPTGSGFLS